MARFVKVTAAVRMRSPLILTAYITILATAQPPDIDRLLGKIATYDYAQTREPLAAFTRIVEDSLHAPAQLRQIETSLLRFLQSGATPAAKDFVLRELSRIATDASIPLLSELLTRAGTAELARYALARIPGRAADDALRSSLAKTSGALRIAIVNSLGQRRDAKAVALLRPLLASQELDVAEAAAAALAEIADQAAVEALAGARIQLAGPARQHVTEAYILSAGRNKGAALKIYTELIAPQETERIRVAALAGLAAYGPAAAVPVLTAELNSKNSKIQGTAIRLLSGIPGSGITSVLVQQFQKLPPSGQAKLLAALADRGDASAVPLLVAAIKDSTGDVRAAALSGLGELGDSSSIGVLAEAAATSRDAEQAAARAGLYRLRGPGIDTSIVSALRSASGPMKIELIMAAGERGISAAADVLIAALQEPDGNVHRESWRALRNIVGPGQAPALLQLVLRASTPSDRREATQTLASVLRRSESARIDGVISAYQNVNAIPARLALLEVMGQSSKEEALPVLRSSLENSAPEIARAAVLALSEWSTPDPLADLLAVARVQSNPALQVLALRGYLKLMALPSKRPAAESARMLSQAMQLARQPAERKTILSLLPLFPCKESLQIAEAATKDEHVAKEAAAAVEQIRSPLR
jgi:HEAT repeat protein